VEGGGKFDRLDLDPTNVVWLVAANSVVSGHMAFSGVHTQYGGGLRLKQIDCFKKKYTIIIHTLKVPKHSLLDFW